MDKPDKKFELIHEIVTKEDNVLNITELCRIAGVSRSGYYRWMNAEDVRQAREKKDQEDFSLILQAYQFRGYAKGIHGPPYKTAASAESGGHECEENSTAYA